MIFVCGRIELEPAHTDAFIEAISAIIETTRKEKGCTIYAIARDVVQSNVLWIAKSGILKRIWQLTWLRLMWRIFLPRCRLSLFFLWMHVSIRFRLSARWEFPRVERCSGGKAGEREACNRTQSPRCGEARPA